MENFLGTLNIMHLKIEFEALKEIEFNKDSEYLFRWDQFLEEDSITWILEIKT